MADVAEQVLHNAPALLMLPWADRILLTYFSASNVRWLRCQLADELHEAERHKDTDDPWKYLQVTCLSERPA